MNQEQTPSRLPLSELLEIFSDQVKLISGSVDRVIEGLSQPSEANAHDLIALSEPNHLEEAKQGRARVWIISPKLVSDDLRANQEITLLSSENPKLTLALVAKKFFRPSDHHLPAGNENIHPSAVIDSTAKLSANVIVGPQAVIGKGCVIEENCVIGAGCVIENNVRIGARSHIHPLAFIGHDCELGEECEVKPHAVIGGEGFGYATDVKNLKHHRVTHFGRVILGDRVHIGSGTTVDRGTFSDSKIGDDAKIDNLCHFGHNIEIGHGTIITGGVVVAGSVKIGSACVIGGGTSIAGHLEIVDQVQIGGRSGVTKSITSPGAYGGHPLQPLKDYLRTQSSLPSLPGLRKSVQKLLKRIPEDKS